MFVNLRLLLTSYLEPFYVLLQLFFQVLRQVSDHFSCLQKCCNCFAVKLQKCFVDYKTSPDIHLLEDIMTKFSSLGEFY